MHFPYRTVVALFMLVTFVTGIAFYSINPAWVAHELAHDHATAVSFLDHDHFLQDEAPQGDEDMPFGDAAHKLLHVLSHCAQLPGSWHFAFAESAGEHPYLLVMLAPPRAEVEPLFRPPRNISLT